MVVGTLTHRAVWGIALASHSPCVISVVARGGGLARIHAVIFGALSGRAWHRAARGASEGSARLCTQARTQRREGERERERSVGHNDNSLG